MEITRKIKIQNTTRGIISYVIPNRNVRRTLQANASTNVPFEELEEGLFDPGIKVLFKEGMLKVLDHDAAVELELEGEDAIGIKVIPNHEDVVKILEGSMADFFKFMKDASSATHQLVSQVAIEKEITDAGKTKVIKDYTHIDVLAVILRNRQDKEANQK